MPRACPVEYQVRSQQKHLDTFRCHRLAPWSFTLVANKHLNLFGCHGLAPWSFTLVANKHLNLYGCHGLAPWSIRFVANKQQLDTFRCHAACPLAFSGSSIQASAALVVFVSYERDTPRGKPVASKDVSRCFW